MIRRRQTSVGLMGRKFPIRLNGRKDPPPPYDGPRPLPWQPLPLPITTTDMPRMTDGHQRWLEVQAEPGTCQFTLSRCVTLADLQADGDYKLILADIGGPQNVLKVLKGTSVIAETTLPDLPPGVLSLYNDTRYPRVPVVAVASGPSVYVYRNLKPYYKFSLPPLEVNSLEQDLWLQIRNGGIDSKALYDMLLSLQQEIGFSRLSQQSQNLLIIPMDKEEEIRAHLSAVAPFPLSRKTVITCMASLKKCSSDADAVSCLILGSEDGSITFVESEAFTVLQKVEQCEDHGPRTIPSSIHTFGLLDVEYRVVICNRNGKITLLRRGWDHSKVLVQLVLMPVEIALLPNGQLVVATNDHLECYSKKGRRQWDETLKGQAVELALITLDHLSLTLIAISIRGGQVCLYSGRHLVDVIHAHDTVTAITFGRFGQEDHCLILVTAEGNLLVKILKRTAQFTYTPTPPAAQVVPKLSIPKRSRLLMEQIARERELGVEIHQAYQKSLFRLRLLTAKSLADSVNKSSHLISTDAKIPLKMSAQVFGLGPTFKIRLTLDNMAADLTTTPPPMQICVHYNHSLYHVAKPYLNVPLLVPGLVYNMEVVLTTVGEVMVVEEVIVCLLKKDSTKPLLSAVVHIPVCDVLPIEI